MLHEQIGIPACFSLGEKLTDDPNAITRSGQNLFMSVYRTKIADQCRLITVTWCKNLLLHGLTISVQGPELDSQYTCKIELKTWYFWKKQGSKQFLVDGKPVDVFWDLKSARFNGEAEPSSGYYVAVVCDEEVVLLLGNLKKEAYRKTRCRPALIDPVLVSRKEHIFGKKKFLTRVKFHDKGSLHEISIECKNNGVIGPEMEIRIDGDLVIHVKHLQWKFRGNESVLVNKGKIEVFWDVHDWLFIPGLRHASFVFKPTVLSTTSPSSCLSSSFESGRSSSGSSDQGLNPCGMPEFCLFLYAWKVD